MIQIAPLEPDESLLTQLNKDLNHPMLLFISANAVHQAAGWIHKSILAKETCIAVIGKATARAAEDVFGKVDIQTQDHLSSTSESLLQHPQLQQLQSRPVFIFKGEGGRTLLTDTLRQRGADVREIVVYHRQAIDYSAKELEKNLQQASVILATSGEILQAIQRQFSPWAKSLRQKPLLVLSQRIQQLAVKNGFKQVWVTEQASDEGIINALKLVN